jgi:dTDP-4-amino-4,6-dideoxygalactose transaminase
MHYPVPLHMQKCYKQLGYQQGDFPVAEKAARECLSLPIYPELSEAQMERVADEIKGFLEGFDMAVP